jgi:simple sugar transport system permease protein
MDALLIQDFLGATIRIAMPLLVAALGGILSERAGTFAVGLEGQMLCGALAGIIGTHFAGSLGLGLVAAAAGGAMFGAVVAIATVRFNTEHMVTGIAANILALGLTSYLLRAAVGGGQAPVLRVPMLQPWPVPGLSEIPLAGPLLFQQPPLTYIALVLFVGVSVFLFRTRAGLTLRAVGENPLAAFAAGAQPARVRTAAIIAGAALAGLAGAVLTLQQVGTFTDGMTHGRGYLALAAIIVGRWMPLGTLAGCLLFGAAEALQLRVQTLSLPVSSYVIQMAPYLLALVVLAGMQRSSRMPAAIGQPLKG